MYFITTKRMLEVCFFQHTPTFIIEPDSLHSDYDFYDPGSGSHNSHRCESGGLQIAGQKERLWRSDS